MRARAPRERAWPAAARSLRRAGGEGEGQVSVCGLRAPARGFCSTHPPPDPGSACGWWPRFPVTFWVTPYFLPSRLPLRPSTSTSHSPGHHSGVLFPGQGDPWGEPSVARSRLVPVPSLCCAHARESRLCAADPEKPHVQSSPQGQCAVFLPSLSTGLAPFGADLPNIQIPAHPAPTFRSLERLTCRPPPGVGLRNQKARVCVLFCSSVQWV